MRVVRVVLRSLVVASVAVATVIPAGSVSAGPVVAAPAPLVEAADTQAALEADTAHHGHAVLWDGLLDIWLESENHGPDAVSDMTVELTFSAPPQPDASLPDDCLRGGHRTILCRAGELRAASTGRGRALRLRFAGKPAEVVIAVATAWNGGAADRNHPNDRHTVLVPATGDAYAF
ncbi:hypothetical protein ABZ532_17580 [Streptomyces sp. NPDC019396]|uniref:hypothetical protein n=1 Tax=Streptomyces sp. NPDC019396 TaxID=3154687 RepID=UPI0033E76040